MSDLKTILVHVDETPHCPTRLAVAEALARRHQAELIATYVVAPLFLPIFMPGEVDPGVIEIIEAQRKSARAKAEAFFAGLKSRMPAAVWQIVDSESQGLEADIVSALAGAARRADLTIVGQAGPAEGDSAAPGLVPEHLVLQAGRPILVVPYAGRFTTVSERVMVAWNDSRESARALHDALPLLRKASAVTLVQVADADLPGDVRERARTALQGVVRLLQRHGVKAVAELTPSDDRTGIGELLLSRAADLGADLLVMGAYGHSRFRELVLGGATREILSAMTLPVLLAH
jgi:nucleotide-binding universal stress UspA family protein